MGVRRLSEVKPGVRSVKDEVNVAIFSRVGVAELRMNRSLVSTSLSDRWWSGLMCTGILRCVDAKSAEA